MRIRLSPTAVELPQRARWHATVDDTATPVRCALEVAGVPVDLTGQTVSVRLVRASDSAVIRDWSPVTIDAAASGQVSFGLLAAEVAAPVELLVTIRAVGATTVLFPGPQVRGFSIVVGALAGGASGGIVVPLLDFIATPHACYSLCKRRSAYTGPCVRIRRASDNAELDVGFAGRMLDVAAAQSFAGAGNAYVAIWYDQSPNLRHATQTAAIVQPQIISSGAVLRLANNSPAVRFVGAGLITPTFTAIAQADVVIAGRFGSVDVLYLCDGITTTNRVLIGCTATIFRYSCNGSTFVSAGTCNLNPHAFALRSDSGAGSDDRLHIDGGAGTGGAAGTHSVTGLTIGSHRTVGTFSDSWITDVLVGPRNTTADLNSIGVQFAGAVGSTWTPVP